MRVPQTLGALGVRSTGVVQWANAWSARSPQHAVPGGVEGGSQTLPREVEKQLVAKAAVAPCVGFEKSRITSDTDRFDPAPFDQ